MGIELAIGALASGVFAGSTFSLAAGLTLGFSFTAVATSLGLGILQSVLTPKPKSNINNGSGQIKSAGITQNIRQAITTRRTIYGEVRVGGAFTFMETSENDKYLHIVLTFADHESEEIGEVWFDDVSIPPDAIDGSGMVISGPYANKVRLKKYLGTSTQTADSDLTSETSADSNFRGRGVTYMYIRLEFDRDVFPGRIPVITAFIKGKKLYDPRDAVTRYSPNAAMMVNDYMTTAIDALTPGVGVDQADIDSTSFTASANASEEMVTTTNLDDSILSADPATEIITLTGVNDRLQYQLGDQVVLIGGSLPTGLAAATNYYVIPYQRKDTVRIKLATSLANALAGTAVNITATGTGTIRKNAEPRYFGGGIIETSEQPDVNITTMLTAMGGTATNVGGKWYLKAAIYSSPVFTFDEGDIISPIVLRTKVSRRDRFNLVKGVYVSPLNDGETSDYPPIENATYVTNDNGKTLPIDFDLPFTQRPHTAQRLAKIKLEKHRQELFFEADYKLNAMQVQPGDNVYINNTRFGWTNKIFEVVSWTLTTKKIGNSPLFYVKMSLQETASAVYDWNNGEETSVDPAPNTNLPNPFVVAAPTGLASTPFEITTASGDLTYKIRISWTPAADIFVTNGGWYEIQFKESSETDWSRSFRAEDIDEYVDVLQVKPGVLYDLRMRSVNRLGVRSAYSSLFGINVTSPSGATISLDYLLLSGSVTEYKDFGLLTETPPDEIDYESLT